MALCLAGCGAKKSSLTALEEKPSLIAFEAYYPAPCDIYILNLDTKENLKITNDGNPKNRLSWGPQGQIVFDMLNGNNWDIFIINEDGRGMRNLTQHPSNDIEPCYSPANGKIAFSSIRDGNWEIYVMDINGKNLQRLTNNPAEDANPRWSPDGKQIAFESTRDRRDGSHDIYIMDASGANVRRLTDERFLDCCFPRWTPDGKKIIFSAAIEKKGEWYVYQLYEIDIKSRKIRLLTYGPLSYADASLSPDGQRIVLSGREEGKGMGLFLMDINGKNIQEVKVPPKAEIDYISPSFSSDGKRIAYIYTQETIDIFISDLTGKHFKCLTGHKGRNLMPSISPDGKKVAFSSDRDGNWEIYVVDIESGKIRRLTNNPAKDIEPCWSPDGKEIAFSSKRGGYWDIYIISADGKRECNSELTHTFTLLPGKNLEEI